MTNKERQKRLDEKKWLASERKGFDMSAWMEWCEHCDKKTGMFGTCSATQEERETACLCATAYNRMQRARK